MAWAHLLLIVSLLQTNSANIKLFNTENMSAVQSYDCIYYTNVTARNNETTPYCIRTNESVSLNRSFTTNTCGHSGKEWTFGSLKEMNISQDEVLAWNSSIEMADRYAAYLTTGDEQFVNDRICNCSSNTFGKFCEYEFMTKNTFEQTIRYQFDLKKKYRNGSQLWGNITCYTMLTDCYFGLRCLTWQNICDRKQQCMYGIDEDRCEELEYNECEDNEYRCEDGSCIAEEYWLDGEYDCSDKSDESESSGKILKKHFCAVISSQFDCDEATGYIYEFACGDGQFVPDGIPEEDICYNYRLVMFFCELRLRKYEQQPKWTLDNGHCVEKGWIEKNLTDMNESEKCVYYLKCKLSDGASDICDDVLRYFYILCQNKTIKYPSKSIFYPYLGIFYELVEFNWNGSPKYVLFNGSIKCIGRQTPSDRRSSSIIWSEFQYMSRVDNLFCSKFGATNVSSPQKDNHCWHDTKQSFLCQNSFQCISRHRLRNGIIDCPSKEDESDDQQCYMKEQHRFKCSGNSSLCLSIARIGNGIPDCSESDDEYIPQLKWDLLDRQCTVPNSIECNVLRSYIRSPSSISTTESDKVLIFRQYCDTLFHLPKGFDESLCKEWKCPRDQYQCLSGHCITIPLPLVILAHRLDWNCPDASDNIGLFGMAKLSDHNAQILNYTDLHNKKAYLSSSMIHDSYVAFPTFCNYTNEYGCILAGVDEPLNFTVNRPCIKLAQIGDGTIDCYGGLDERNVLTCGGNVYEQRGLDFHCSDQECIPYHRLCKDRCSNDADNLLCVQLETFWNSSCKYPPYTDRCMYSYKECDSIKIFKYYCDQERPGSTRKPSLPYRFVAWYREKIWNYLDEYPLSKDITTFDYINSQHHETAENDSHVFHEEENDGREGWICGRGVAIKKNKTNQIQCFCPPSLYGEYCQYFSDRITVIVSLNNIPSKLFEQESETITILALLLSNDDIIDHDVFHLVWIFSKELNKKFRFNLIHQRPKVSLNSYRVRFEAYHLNMDSSLKFVAVWEYPVHFPFLPSYRLAQVLKFEKEPTLMTTTHICQTANPCLHNSTCHSVMNQINDTSVYYCHCQNNTFGRHCEHLVQPVPSYLCSKHSLQRSLSLSKYLCLCPTHLYGSTCHLNHTCVNKNPCGVNRGKCYINPDNITHDYVCVCDKKFFGDHCQNDSSMVKINFTDFLFVQIPSNFIMSSIIQLCDLHNETLDLIIREKRVYQGLPPSITEIYHGNYQLPKLGIMKLYHKYDLSNDYVANLKQPDYFFLYFTGLNVTRMNLTTVINMTNYCPYTRTAFERNVSDVSHLSHLFTANDQNVNSRFNVSVMIFKYHFLCDLPYALICFHDDNYLCLCDIYGHAECFRYNSTLDECHGRCRAGGQCIHGDLDDRRDFVCLCSRCYYGSICQHNTELFSFTLETLLTNDLYSSSVIIQYLFVSLLIIIPFILLLIGAMNNICCYATFNRPKPLLVGVGHYLRTASIINQLTLFMLLLKLIHLVLTIKGYVVHQLMNTILCKVVSYLLACSSRMSYWLMGMVAIERVYVTWYLNRSWLKSPRIAKRIIVAIIIGIAASDVHELIYYQSIEDPKSIDINNSTWCVTSYPSAIITYNQVNIILNYILPFLINLLSTIILLILITRRRAKAKAKQSIRVKVKTTMILTIRMYINLLIEKKELILAPLITMLPQLFFLPHFILSFSLACQEFKVNWQRYLLIISYLTTYLPQVLSYKLYVSPSSFYKDEFHATKLYARLSRWRALIR